MQALQLVYHLTEISAYADLFAERNGVDVLLALLERTDQRVRGTAALSLSFSSNIFLLILTEACPTPPPPPPHILLHSLSL